MSTGHLMALPRILPNRDDRGHFVFAFLPDLSRLRNWLRLVLNRAYPFDVQKSFSGQVLAQVLTMCRRLLTDAALASGREETLKSSWRRHSVDERSRYR